MLLKPHLMFLQLCLQNETVSTCVQLSSGSLPLSDTQCHQLIQMLQKNLSLSQNASPGVPSTTWHADHSINTVQVSGTSHSVSQVYAVKSKNLQSKWIIDTGATDHITPFLCLLEDVHSCNSILQLPNGNTAVITHTGTLVLNCHLTLTIVLCVPTFAYNLLSISKLLQDTTHQVVFLANHCYIQDHFWKTTIELGKEDHGLYVLNAGTDSQHQLHSSASTVSTALAGDHNSFSAVDETFSADSNVDIVEQSSFHFNAQTSSIDLWHARLGHVPAQVVKMLPVKCTTKVLDICDSCHFAKQSRISFSNSTTKSDQLFDLVHADLRGPYRYKTHGNCTLFLALVEDKSRSTWVYLLPDKATVSSVIQEFITLIKTQFGVVIKTLRIDNGTEFMNTSVTKFLTALGIIHQSSCVYTPQQNGLVERKHRHLLNCARALRFHAGLPVHFWGDFLLTATYLKTELQLWS